MTGFPAGVRLFGVRHHSPRASAVLSRFLEEGKPAAVLIEGPSDAGGLIDALADPETKPPVAILGYRTDGTPGSALWPFADYSPEFTALRWGRRRGARVEFVDVPCGVALAADRETEGKEDAGGEGDPDAGTDVHEACAAATGRRTFEEFWEAEFEAPPHGVESFGTAVTAYAELIRAAGPRERDRARDAFMTRRVREILAEGVPPERVVVVAGAAHTAAFAAGDVDPAAEASLPAAVPSACTLVPFSFPRLSEQLGYGAGNRAPMFYQRAHDAGCDYRRAALETLIGFSDHLRLRGFTSSLADVIEAYRLAVALAAHRGKAEPGLDEVREAAAATLCRGESRHLDEFLWPGVVGRNVGRVASRIGRNSLQEEFWREVRARRLPESDAPERFALRLNNEVEVGASIFLHRLRIAEVPYATWAGASSGVRAAKDEAGGHAALSRVREAWEAQWTPATDVALVERIALGDSLEAVATKVLEKQLAEATTTGAAAGALLESVVTACPQTTASALAACERLASADDDLPSLAAACRALSGLVSYGTSRAASAAGDEAVAALCRKTYDRAVLRVDAACTGSDEAVAPALEALRTLHDIALSQPLVDRALWIDAARGLAASWSVNPAASGMACGLLYLAQAITDADVAASVAQRLSNACDPGRAAAFLSGFLSVNALVLVKSRPVVQALDAFVSGIPADRFRPILPVLRRALGPLGATERRYLLENIVALRELGQDAAAAKAVVQEKDREKLKDLGKDLEKAMGDLDDLL